MTKSVWIFALSALVLTNSLSLAVDCDDDPRNLLGGINNCGFDTSTDGWRLQDPGGGDSLAHSDLGEPDAGSAAIDAFHAGNFKAEMFSPCVEILPSTAYGFGARIAVHPDSDPGSAPYCNVDLITFSDDACTNFDNGEILSLSADSSFQLSAGSHFTDPTVQTAFLWVTCTRSSVDFIMLFDNAFIGEGLTVPIELLTVSVE